MKLKLGRISGAEKPPFVYWNLFWWLGAVVAISFLGWDLAKSDMSHLPGRDFTNLWTAGRLALEGDAWKAFDADTFRLALLRQTGILSLQNYSYPPHALFIAMPFALMPYYIALVVWTLLGFGFFVWAAKPFVPFHPALAALTPAAAINIWNGHYGFYLGGLWLLTFAWANPRPHWAGVTAGLLTFKPHLGLFIAARVAARPMALFMAVASLLLLVAASMVAFGTGTWVAFFAQTTAEQADILTKADANSYLHMMPSAYCMFGRGVFGIVAQFIFASAAVGILVYRRVLDPFSAATATFLIIPYTFNYDMTVVSLGIAILVYSKWSELNLGNKILLTLAFWAPELTWVVPWFVPPILLTALWVQTGPRLRISAVGDAGHTINCGKRERPTIPI